MVMCVSGYFIAWGLQIFNTVPPIPDVELLLEALILDRKEEKNPLK